MRIRTIGVIALIAYGFGCGKSAEEKGLEAAKKAEEDELAEKRAKGEVAVTKKPPVGEGVHVPCERLIADPAAYGTALNEKEPVTVRDDTSKDGDATAACAIIRGGKKMTKAEQDALLKKQPRLGVLSGDPICLVTAYCSKFETEEHLRSWCTEQKNRDDDTMGGYACVQIVATGVDDVQVFRFFDADTKCRIMVSSGGPNADNDMIRTCAKIARDQITPAQLDPTPMPKTEGSGSAGSAAGSAK